MTNLSRSNDRTVDRDMKSGEHVRVLVVEDSRRVTDRLRELLDQIPEVETVATVESELDAVSSLHEVAPDVVILDLHLKQGTGFGVLKSMAADSPRPVVVVLTNFALPQYRLQAQALGVEYFLDKSREYDRLPEILREIAANRGTPS
jgi:two-component system, OmpR family, response regulator